ncbi:MAG TPA: D-amino acid dehydrogenase [Burkholderiaceae bacterium]|nr:D-amino acid dehydrogenase [Burkholderiaceae bacterium]
MQVAVIGGGVIGVCTAYFLADAGHEVALIERCGNVAEQSSFGNAGVVAPAYATPWASPGMAGKFLSGLFKDQSPVQLRPRLEPAMWRWVSQWVSECDLQRFRTNSKRMQRLALYSRDILHQLREREQWDYEQTRGFLQLLRTERDIALLQPLLQLATEDGSAHSLLDATAARAIEPALSHDTPLAGGLYFPDDETGNCSLFTKQMKQAAQASGVVFHFGTEVKTISSHNRRISLRLDDTEFTADAVVVAAGVDSAKLLAPLGIQIPLYPVKGYSATASIKDYEQAPRSAIIDEAYKVTVARMGNRVRIAGLAELGSRTTELREAALRTLIKVGEDWFPNAANYGNAQFWCGARPMLPDGPPLIGATPVNNVYLNIGHGPTGWAMAVGSAKLVADIVSGVAADIDTDGLTLTRYQH